MSLKNELFLHIGQGLKRDKKEWCSCSVPKKKKVLRTVLWLRSVLLQNRMCLED